MENYFNFIGYHDFGRRVGDITGRVKRDRASHSASDAHRRAITCLRITKLDTKDALFFSTRKLIRYKIIAKGLLGKLNINAGAMPWQWRIIELLVQLRNRLD